MRSILILILSCLCVLAGGAVRADDSALAARAEEVRRQHPKTPEESVHLQRLLVAYADSLNDANMVTRAARCLESAGILAVRRNELETAIELWQRGLAVARDGGSRKGEASLLNALAIGHSMADDIDAALPVYADAIELRTALSDTLGLSRTWGNLANLYVETGRLAEALDATMTEEKWLAHTENRRGRLANALRRATILTTLQRSEEAKRYADRATELAYESGVPNEVGQSVMRQGEVLLDLGQYAEARDSLSRAVDLLRTAGDLYLSSFAEQSRLFALLGLGEYDACLQGARELADALESQGPKRLLLVALRLKGHALFQLDRADEAEAVLSDALSRFEAERAQLDDAASRAGIFFSSGEIYAALARVHLAAGDTLAAFDLVERGRAPLFRDHTRTTTASHDELQAVLARENAALVLFNDPRFDPLVAFVVHETGLAAIEIGDLGPLVEDARTTRRLLSAGEDLEACRPALRRLGEAIARPVIEAIPASINRTYVVPPAALVGLPLELLEDASGRRWEDRASISLLPNASSLVALVNRPVRTAGFAGFADPEFPGDVLDGPLPASSARSASGTPLPEARNEVRAIAPANADLHFGRDATANALTSETTRKRAVLHLATHTAVDAIDGARSALLLSGPAGIDDVTAMEILDFDLEHDLVVLSGCSTFGWDRLFGEGWLGLPRSFLTAGARSVVSTLWDVDDDGARRFVEAFYAGLREGMSRDRALVHARAECRKRGMPPRDWAGFVLSGVSGATVPALVSAPDDRN